jgi:hypothetical protein
MKTRQKERMSRKRERVRVLSGNQVSDGLLVCNHNIWWAVAGWRGGTRQRKTRDLTQAAFGLVFTEVTNHPSLSAADAKLPEFRSEKGEKVLAAIHSNIQNLVTPFLYSSYNLFGPERRYQIQAMQINKH